jgi:hypothetical protein
MGEKSKYAYGLMLMLEYVINCVKNDKENGDYYSEENNDIAIKGGNLLYESGGIDTIFFIFTISCIYSL